MAFIGFALLIACGLSLIIISDAGQLVGMSQDQMSQIIPLMLVLFLIASGMFGRRVRLSQMLNGALMWAGLFTLTIAGYSYRFELSEFSNRIWGEITPGIAIVEGDTGSVVFRKGFGNTFRMNTIVNGVKILMIFDTGASAVVLTNKDAQAAGIDIASLQFNIQVQTANGVGRAAAIHLKRIEIGGIVREDIRAFISEPDALETSLLGMSFLQTLSAYTVRKDTLELLG